jgi:transcriptional regulator of heat shock response
MVNIIRENDKTQRQRDVLRLIVKHHIATAEPIGSSSIARDMGLSSATIRNIMFELEETGLIFQPHASAGRLPTDMGFRSYVNGLIESDLLETPKDPADETLYYLRSNSIEDVLLRGLELCSRMTSQTCVAVLPTLRIKERLVEKLEERLKDALASLYDFDDRLYMDGAHYLAEQPEFRDIDKISAVLKMLGDKKRLMEVLEKNAKEGSITIHIGSENGSPSMGQCTLITANYGVEDDITGTLGIIGPTRMEYRRVIPAVRSIATSISRLFEEML